jgi:hypothetical protein
VVRALNGLEESLGKKFQHLPKEPEENNEREVTEGLRFEPRIS